MTEHPIDLSTRLIDTGARDTPPNRVLNELSELNERVSLIESFSHVVLVQTDDGLVAFDSSGAQSGQAVVEALRRWSDEPVHSIVYTHGHLDHVGGSPAFAADAQTLGRPQPRVVGHQRVDARFDRYDLTSGYNQIINQRQFGGAASSAAAERAASRSFVPRGTLRPDVTYGDRLTESIGGTEFEYNHCLGETDDHTWTWIPSLKTISAGDQFIWNFPNCGNPQKVQRFPLEWAASLREMISREAELFIPAHGLPISGRDRIANCLETVATTLETLTSQVVAAMNTGAPLDDILHSVSVPEEALALPYLQPMYDEPEFVIRNIWRLYGGWWDGNPARLKPPSDGAVGAEVAALVGGVEVLVERAMTLSAAGDHRLACQLIEYAVAAEPESAAAHEARSTIYMARRGSETSLMAKGIYRSAAADSEEALTGEAPETKLVLDLGSD